jgi:hypothetical protein
MSAHDPRSTPSGRKVREEERKREKEREINSVNRGHYVCHAARLQCGMGSTRTSLGPMFSY